MSCPLVARWLATWFGCGLSPRAPGTVGSLGAVPLHLLLALAPPAVHAAAAVAIAALGVWAAQQYALGCGQRDPQRVVIDEVAGTVIAMGLVRHAPLYVQCAALVAFRLFDIFKPWPISYVDRNVAGGFGIMADDILAGIIALLLVQALLLVFGGPWTPMP